MTDLQGDAGLKAWPTLTWSQILDQHQEINFSSYSDEELWEVNATSPVQGLLPMPDEGWVPGVSAAARALLARDEAQMERHLRGPIRLRAAGDLAALVSIRRKPAMIGTITALGNQDSSEVRPGQTLGVLFGLAVVGRGLVGLLEEVRDEFGSHSFALSTPSREAERIIEAGDQLVSDQPGISLMIEAFAPDPDTPRRLRILMTSAGQGWQIRATTDGASWNREMTTGPGGKDWPEMFTDLVTQLVGISNQISS